ncbi:hypothetical protein C731_3699 [Mycolicibacterium hassiacum DSM 44199]|uniref:Uncharacterized protein n=1 Tax=Mycolicibacterium hassiacum (strain DSM 44199 / CIP 105218 / JCM 12690 / 3849) TaxID=1122247 RepID=K5B7M5_MYCHD|nr:hypothetical protein [Mycolicibacterium hassiacum]EKF22208.1 hypothetical protein C731_3699 [Mycolicibacterium hassiacum DSM 44199]MDA4087519.1 hypothetical protein [Mycolicibacterium hassiacum DSM 44199]VCT91857.1 hypothetical protein MHAS_03580 [Mycolicibacterium hassiacum DSM 44199]
MNKLNVFAAGAVLGAAATLTALFGTGAAAAAPDVVGDTYADAASAIESSGGTVTIASRVGDKLDLDDCIVVNAWDSSFLRIDTHSEGEVAVALNCNGAYATSKNPGTSVQHPMGRAAKTQAEIEAERAEEEEIANPSIPDN